MKHATILKSIHSPHPTFARFSLPLWCLAFGLALTPRPVSAQPGIDGLILTAGTTALDSLGRPWAYVVWQAPDPDAIRSRMFAVYAKTGDAASASDYERQAVVGVQTDPLVIAPLLQRSVNLGQNLAELESTLNNLFEKLMPDPSLPLAEKLSAVIRGSLDQPDHFRSLILMARVHPAVALSLGWAHAAQIPGPAGAATTFELRTYDMASDTDLGVAGRVTVRAGQPVVLPAPGRPVEVPDTTPKGDLNARMRWATPDGLRRVSMLQQGFNVYRVPKAVAEANGFGAAPPATSVLLAMVQANPLVHRLNHVPVLNPLDLTEAEALDLAADPETFFFSDWNDRFNPATTLPQEDFVNGAQFYYYLTARDLLSRDGLVSAGTLITICDRMPPKAPSRVRVSNHYVYDGAASHQHLRVVWSQNANTPADTTTAYYVYRWTGLPELHANAGDPMFNLVAGPIAHLPGSPTNSFLDSGPGAPATPADAGVTVWYTVVALDNGACAPGGNRSPHSAPAYGVLRDRTGPDPAGGRIEITCTQPSAEFAGTGPDTVLRDLPTNAHHYRLTAQRTNPSILWAEYVYEIPGVTAQPVPVGRRLFAGNEPAAVLDFALARAGLPANATPLFRCRVGANNGTVSEFASSSVVGAAPAGQTRAVTFTGAMESRRVAPGGECDAHDPHGGGDGTLDDICVTAFSAPGTKELKFYRRVENGPLTLICQREADFEAGEPEATCCDGSMPAQPSDICYYVQSFDEHGNAGPMRRIGCVQTGPNAPLPTPILSPIAALGTSTNAQMRLQWFCPPYGVERFEVWVAGLVLPPAKAMSKDMTLVNEVELGLPLPGVVPDPKLVTYRTRRIGPAFGSEGVFVIEADVVQGNPYTVFVRAVGEDGSMGPRSNAEKFTWHAPQDFSGPDVTWPARPLPAVTLTNFPGVTARMFTTNDAIFNAFPQQRFEGVGVRVGELTIPQYPSPLTNAIPGVDDPLTHVYRSARDARLLFPLVIYRAQIPNAEFPVVSGDMVQVTPLMEEIAFDRTPLGGGGNAVLVRDPFIRLIPKDPTLGAQAWELYLLDTQPVVEDASYQYFLVRLDEETREITEVTPTNPVPIQP